METYRFTIYTGIYLVSFIISLIVFFIAWRKRQLPVSLWLSVMMIGVAVWTLSGIFEVSAIPSYLKVFWSKTEYIGGTATPVILLIFTLVYSKNLKLVSLLNIILLSIIPLVIIILAFTNEYHGLIWAGFEPGPPGTNSLIYHHGKAFWYLYIIYSYLLLSISTYLLLRTSFNLPFSLGLQTLFLLAALILPWGASFLYISGLNPIPGLELTRVAFSLTGLIFAYAIIRLKLLEISPIARNILIDKMNVGLIVLDDSLRIIDMNNAALMASITERYIPLGKMVSDVHWKDQKLKNYLLSQNNDRTEIYNEDPFFYCLEIQKTALKGNTGKIFGYLIQIHDITHIKLLERSYEEKARQLQEANADKDKFVSLLSHDLRNPLGTLFGLSEIIYNEYETIPEKKKKELITAIFKASDQTFQLLENLLEWAKQNTGQIIFHPEVFDLYDVIGSVNQLLSEQAKMKEIVISNQVGQGIMIYADKNMVMTILRNVLSNAIKFTYTGGTITITSDQPVPDHSLQSMITVSVRDSGIGFTPELLATIFKADKRVSGQGTMGEKGTGLGLMITKQMVMKNGGTLTIESEPEKGSTVTFTLPLAQDK